MGQPDLQPGPSVINALCSQEQKNTLSEIPGQCEYFIPRGVIQLVNDGDDRMDAKLRTQKNP